MLRKLTPILALVLVSVLMAAPAATAENKVEGTMDLTWNGCWSGPSQEMPPWVGTIDIDGDGYDMLFFNVGTGWPPNHTPGEPLMPFNEVWAIYDGLELAFDDECAIETFEGDPVLWGRDAGITNPETSEFGMTGTVVEAFGDFDGLAGSSVSMSGTIEWDPEGAPLFAPGVFQID